MKLTILMLFVGGGAILLGLPYIYRAFGPTEAEVVLWGKVCSSLGAALLLLAAALRPRRSRIVATIILGGGYSLVALLQVPPSILWFMFHGSGIAGGSSWFVTHWGYAIPHLTLLIVSLLILYHLSAPITPPRTAVKGTGS